MRLHSKMRASISVWQVIYSNSAIWLTMALTFWILTGCALKILTYSVSQRYGFSPIDDLSQSVLMHINSRRIREFFKFFLISNI